MPNETEREIEGILYEFNEAPECDCLDVSDQSECSNYRWGVAQKKALDAIMALVEREKETLLFDVADVLSRPQDYITKQEAYEKAMKCFVENDQPLIALRHAFNIKDREEPKYGK